MSTRTRWCWGALVIGVSGLVGASPVAAGTDVPIDDATLDSIRELIPESDPGEYDLTDADVLLEQLLELTDQRPPSGNVDSGSSLTGPCGGFAFSYDGDGRRIDAAMDVGDERPPIDLIDGTQAFTSGNPFQVDTRGVVVYFGFMPRSGDGPMDHEWSITTNGVSIDSGGDPNSAGNNRNAGIVDLDNDLPVKFSAKVKAEGELTSGNLEACIGEGYVDFIGNGLLDPVGLAALAALGGGLLGILFNARPARTWKVGP